MVVFFQVTTEHKKVELALSESEERFREMFERHQSIMLLIEPDSGQIIDSNPAASEFYGYPREVLNKMNIADINQLPPKEVAKERQKALNNQMKQFLFPHRLASGEIRTVEVNSSPIKVNSQMILFSIIRDVTIRENALKEIKKLNERLVQRTNEIESVNNELEAFSYSVSHDLKAPLRSISGFSNALLEDYNATLDEQGKQYLNKIRQSSELMAELIDDLLVLSRITSAELNFGEVNLSQIAQEVIAELQTSDSKREISVAIAPNITVRGDRNLLKIAISNLLAMLGNSPVKRQTPELKWGLSKKTDG